MRALLRTSAPRCSVASRSECTSRCPKQYRAAANGESRGRIDTLARAVDESRSARPLLQTIRRPSCSVIRIRSADVGRAGLTGDRRPERGS